MSIFSTIRPKVAEKSSGSLKYLALLRWTLVISSKSQPSTECINRAFGDCGIKCPNLQHPMLTF